MDDNFEIFDASFNPIESTIHLIEAAVDHIKAAVVFVEATVHAIEALLDKFAKIEHRIQDITAAWFVVTHGGSVHYACYEHVS